jgi:hypothetical protein
MKPLVQLGGLAALVSGLVPGLVTGSFAQTALPPSLRITSGVDTSKPGFLVRTVQVEGIDNGGSVVTSERELNGDLGPNIANLADPWNPVYVGNTQMSLSGNLRYVHDCYVRNDTMWAAHIYGGFYSVINVSNKAAPSLITTQSTPGNYTHNTWLSDSGRRVLYTTDEVSNSVLAAYDVTSTGNMTLLDRLQNVPGSGSILHNTYIRNNFFRIEMA